MVQAVSDGSRNFLSDSKRRQLTTRGQHGIDAKFRRSLYLVTRTGKIARDYCEALGDDNQSHLIKSKPLRGAIYACNRALLSRLSDFCRIDLLADDRSDISWTRKWWPFLVLAGVLVNAGVMVEVAYRHYRCDFTLFSYERVRDKLSHSDRSNITLQQALRARLDELSERLRLSNVTIETHWPFVGQYTILFYLPPALMTHLILSVFFYRGREVLLAMRGILDESREASTWSRLVVEELEHMIRDSLAFMSSKYDQVGDNLTLSGHKSSVSARLRDGTAIRVLTSTERRLAAGHELLKARLKRVALEGRLNRFQRSPRCRDKLELVFSVSFWSAGSVFVIGFALSNTYLRMLFKKHGKTLGKNIFNDTTDALNMLCLFLISILATSLYTAIINTTVLDQLIYVCRMKTIMRHLSTTNTVRVREMISLADRMQHHGHQLDSQLNKLNDALEMDLLVVILQWRLAGRIFGLQRRSVTLMVTYAAYLVTSLSILVRLHSPYMPDDIKQINFALGIVGLVLAAACLTPLAVLHQQWALTFGNLWGLAALLGRLESNQLIRERLLPSCSVATLTLRREVSDALERHKRFACRIYSVPITYPNLIRTGAWLVLILVSLFDSQNSLFGSWLSQYADDPFGVITDDP